MSIVLESPAVRPKKKVKQKNKVVLMFPLPSPIKEMPRIGAPRNELAPFGRAGKGDGGPISILEVITGPEMKMTLKGVDGKLKMAITGIFQGNLNRSSGAQDMLCQYLAEWDKSLAIVRPHFPIGERRRCEGEDTHRCVWVPHPWFIGRRDGGHPEGSKETH